MPRERAKLTDKQERILVQCQLMGLTPKDMQQISNRLIALQKEAEDKREIAEAIHGYTWEPRGANWKITTPEGYVVEARRGSKRSVHYWSTEYSFNIVITKPGTRFKTRHFKEKMITMRDDWKKKLMPENSKELYALIRWSKDIRWEAGTV